MATNQMRREAAKRKLANQQQRRAERARRRQRTAVITSVVVVVVVVVGVVLLSTLPGGGDPATDQAAPTEQAAPTSAPETAPAVAPGSCTFTPTPQEPASKPAPLPTVATASTTGTVQVALQTDRGAIPLTLDRAQGPCAVESFVSLAGAGYFDSTPCHRLTTSDALKVLQCGDPTGTGTGGPGYTINDEPPAALAPVSGLPGVSVYPRGTVAMAKTAAPNSGGSQFFLVYADSTLPPDYTVFGRIGDEGLATLDAVAQAGTDNSNGEGDGKPVTPVTIQSATVS